MKRLNIILFLTLIVGCTANAQTPYDGFAPVSKSKPMLKLSEVTFKAYNSDTTGEVKYVELDKETFVLNYYSKTDSLVKSVAINPMEVKWISVDPLAKKFPGHSPYNFVANMPIRAVDPDGRDIYILFATTGNGHGDEMFMSAALTRQRNIESSKTFDPTKDKVVVLQVADMGKIKQMVEQTVTTYSQQYGQTQEVGIWSHAARQGPIGTEPTSSNPVGSNQMDYSGWRDINFNWTPDANMTFYGCNTGNETMGGKWIGSFARKVSALNNFDGVTVSGQSTSAYPSFYPNVRETNLTRSLAPSIGFSIGDTYMVGGNNNEGGESMWFAPMAAPAANPFNVYQDGKKVGTGFQSTSPSTAVTY